MTILINLGIDWYHCENIYSTNFTSLCRVIKNPLSCTITVPHCCWSGGKSWLKVQTTLLGAAQARANN